MISGTSISGQIISVLNSDTALDSDDGFNAKQYDKSEFWSN